METPRHREVECQVLTPGSQAPPGCSKTLGGAASLTPGTLRQVPPSHTPNPETPSRSSTAPGEWVDGGDNCHLISEPVRLQFPANDRLTQARPKTCRPSDIRHCLPCCQHGPALATSWACGWNFLPRQSPLWLGHPEGWVCFWAARTSLPQGDGVPAEDRRATERSGGERLSFLGGLRGEGAGK